MGVDRRGGERVTLGTRLKVFDGNTHALVSEDSRLRNYAKHGFGFITEEPFKRRSVYRFKWDLGGLPIEVKARIMHVRVEATYYVCGAFIEGLTFWQRSRLNRSIMARSPKTQRKYLLYSALVGIAVVVIFKPLLGLALPGTLAAFSGTTIFCFLLAPF